MFTNETHDPEARVIDYTSDPQVVALVTERDNALVKLRLAEDANNTLRDSANEAHERLRVKDNELQQALNLVSNLRVSAHNFIDQALDDGCFDDDYLEDHTPYERLIGLGMKPHTVPFEYTVKVRSITITGQHPRGAGEDIKNRVKEAIESALDNIDIDEATDLDVTYGEIEVTQ